jgi:hypothetical protein
LICASGPRAKWQLWIIDDRQPLPDLDAFAFADRQFIDRAADAGSGRAVRTLFDRGEYRLDVGDIAPFDGKFRRPGKAWARKMAAIARSSLAGENPAFLFVV